MPRKRSRPTSYESDRKRNREYKSSSRSNEDLRNREQQRDTLARKSRRQDPKIRQEEQAQNTIVHRLRRQNPEIRQEEQQRDTIARRFRRQDPEIRQEEQAQNTIARRSRRQDPDVRQEEQAQNTIAHRLRRQDPEVRQEEQAQNTIAHRLRRQDPEIRAQEQQQNTTALFQTLTRHYRLEPGPVDSPEVIIIAYTGKAAHNVGGMTAHYAFGLSIGQVRILRAEELNTMRVKYSKLKIIIIDEISLFGRRTFEKLNNRLIELFKKFLGGLIFIVLGHFGQLKPVKDGYIFSSGERGLDALAGNILWDPFLYFELTEIMRQKDDLTFAQALGRLSVGQMTPTDVNLFKTRCFAEYQLPEEGKSSVRLIYRNADVEAYNTRRLYELKTDVTIRISFEAEDMIVGATSEREKRQIRHNLERASTQNTQGLPKTTTILQIGIRYMVTTNIDVPDGLFNGAVGLLKFIEFINGRPGAVYLQFETESIGKNARRTIQDPFYRLNPHIEQSWTPITRLRKTFKVTEKGTGRVIREQYPLVVCEAMTIHKSQGATMESVTVQLDEGLERSLTYVAKTINGLYLITIEMKRLRETAALTPRFQHLRMFDPNKFLLQIVSHNVQSLKAHQSIVRNDHVFRASHLLLLQETWLRNEDDVEIPGMKELNRTFLNEGATTRGTGSIVFGNYKIRFREGPYYNFQSKGKQVYVSACKFENLYVLNVYRSPDASLKTFKEILQDLISEVLENQQNVLLCGDFNELIAENSSFVRFLRDLDKEKKIELLSPIQPTTNAQTTIDGVFGRLVDFKVEVHVYESFSSFHKPLVIRVARKSDA